MSGTVTIEVPDDIRILLEKSPLLKKKFEKLAVEVFREKLLRFMIAEELTRNVEVSEELVMEFDEEIKKGMVERLERLEGSS